MLYIFGHLFTHTNTTIINSNFFHLKTSNFLFLRGKSSAMSAANAAADCIRTWLVTGTGPGETVGMAVYNDKGYYGVQKDIMFSFPCMCVGGEWIVKEGLSLSSFAREKISATEKELLNERDAAMEILSVAENVKPPYSKI